MTEVEWLTCNRPNDLLHNLWGHAKHTQGNEVPFHIALGCRKLRLLGCAGFRLISHLWDGTNADLVAETAEKHADGKVTRDQLDGEVLAARWQELQEPDAEFGRDYDYPFWAIQHIRADAWQNFFDIWGSVALALDAEEMERRAKRFFPLIANEILAVWRESIDSYGYVPAMEGYDSDPLCLEELNIDPPDADRLYDFYPNPGIPISHHIRDIFGNPFRPVAFDPAWRSSTALAIATGIYDDRAFDRLPILADAIQDAGCENEDILNHLRSEGPHVKGCWALDLILGKS